MLNISAFLALINNNSKFRFKQFGVNGIGMEPITKRT